MRMLFLVCFLIACGAPAKKGTNSAITGTGTGDSTTAWTLADWSNCLICHNDVVAPKPETLKNEKNYADVGALEAGIKRSGGLAYMGLEKSDLPKLLLFFED